MPPHSLWVLKTGSGTMVRAKTGKCQCMGSGIWFSPGVMVDHWSSRSLNSTHLASDRRERHHKSSWQHQPDSPNLMKETLDQLARVICVPGCPPGPGHRASKSHHRYNSWSYSRHLVNAMCEIEGQKHPKEKKQGLKSM